jgi:hypothetical protein
MSRIFGQGIAAALLTAVAVHAQTPPPIDPAKADAAFAEARQLSDKEGGRHWGMKLYGAMFFVDPETRAVVANEPDGQGVLHKTGDVYVGTLPESVLVADSPVEWAGKRWTMMRWPLPDDIFTREVKFEHELFHRIQPALRLDASDTPNLQLDTLEGRLWLQLEWRALAAALVAHGAVEIEAIRDALAFRDYRHHLFAGSAASEQSLEIAEGVPEYAGLTAAAPDMDSARWRTIAKLTDPDLSMTFVRSFAYTSGPAYGLLLDRRMPGWTKKVSATSDLAGLLASTLHGGATVSAEQRARYYGEAALRVAEIGRAAKADAEKARYHALLVDGPTLLLPATDKFAFSFNPSALISLDSAGSVYPTFHATDVWGTLDVKEGVLIPTDFTRATLAAPTDTKGAPLQGPGWTLDLAPGWHLAPAAKVGSFTVKKD